jgi:hypothetical protein
MARALSVSADALVFEKDERAPTEEQLLQFEAISQLPPEEQAVVKEVLLNIKLEDGIQPEKMGKSNTPNLVTQQKIYHKDKGRILRPLLFLLQISMILNDA